jgi:hypothetical protein
MSSLQTLNTVNSLSPSVGAGGGPTPVAPEPPSPGGKYELVEGGKEMYYWGDFDKVDNVFGDTYTTQVIAGVMYETTTVQQPPTFEGDTSTILPFTVYASDTEGTRVFKAFDQYGGSWLNVAQPFVIPTDLGYPDKVATDFKPFVDSSPTQRGVAYYGIGGQTLIEILPAANTSALWVGQATGDAGENRYNLVAFPHNVTYSPAIGADWSKILDPQVNAMKPTLNTIPGSTLDNAGYNGIQFELDPEREWRDAEDLVWQYVDGVIGQNMLIRGDQLGLDGWVVFSFGSFSVVAEGPLAYDEVFTRDTGTIWDSTNGVQSIEAY